MEIDMLTREVHRPEALAVHISLPSWVDDVVASFGASFPGEKRRMELVVTLSRATLKKAGRRSPRQSLRDRRSLPLASTGCATLASPSLTPRSSRYVERRWRPA